MKTVFFNGGLANQVFQYIFYRYGQLTNSGDEWYLDDSFFYIWKMHNGYELERVFGLKPQLLSRSFTQDVWDYMIEERVKRNVGIPQLLEESGMKLTVLAEDDYQLNYNSYNGEIKRFYGFDPKVVHLDGDIYYQGYYLRKDWFHAYKELFKRELKFPKITDERNMRYLDRILDGEAASLHIRRGDYVKLGFASDEDIPKYRYMVEQMYETIPDVRFFVFSDDTNWARAHGEELGLNLPRKETVYVEGNSGLDAYKDLQLMSSCRHMILCNSSFCYLAALLNEHKGYILNPTDREI